MFWKVKMFENSYCIHQCVSVCMIDWLNLPVSICLTVFRVWFSSRSESNVPCMQINRKAKWCGRDDLDVDMSELFIFVFSTVYLFFTQKKLIYAVLYGNSSTYFTMCHFGHPIPVIDYSQTTLNGCTKHCFASQSKSPSPYLLCTSTLLNHDLIIHPSCHELMCF